MYYNYIFVQHIVLSHVRYFIFIFESIALENTVKKTSGIFNTFLLFY